MILEKKPKKWTRGCLILCISLFIILTLLDLSKNTYFPRSDSGGYITAAMSLAIGHGYKDISVPPILPKNGWRWPLEFYQQKGYDILKPDYPPFRLYPFILPLCLALIIKIWGKNFIPMQLLIFIFSLGSLLGIWLCFKHTIKHKYIIAIIGLLIFSLFYNFSQRVQAEIPYLFFSLLSLYFSGRYFQQKSTWNFELLVTIILINLAIYTRLIGITLLFAIILYSIITFFKHPSKNLIFLFLSILFIALPFFFYVEVHTTPGTFSSQSCVLRKDGWNLTAGYNKLLSLATVKRMTIQSGMALLRGARCLLAPHYWSISDHFYFPFLLIMAFLFLIGFLKSLLQIIRYSKPPDHLLCYFLAYFAFYSLIPWPDDRFMIAILPFYIYFLLIGLETLPLLWQKLKLLLLSLLKSNQTGKIPAKPGKIKPDLSPLIMSIMVTCLILWKIFWIVRDTHAHDEWSIKGNSFYPACCWIIENTRDEDILLVEDNFALFAVTGRKCFPFAPGEWKNINTEKYLKAKGRIDYLIMSDWEDEPVLADTLQLLEKYERIATPIEISPRVRVYKVSNVIE